MEKIPELQGTICCASIEKLEGKSADNETTAEILKIPSRCSLGKDSKQGEGGFVSALEIVGGLYLRSKAKDFTFTSAISTVIFLSILIYLCTKACGKCSCSSTWLTGGG